MNILYLTLSRIENISSRGIYTDLMREFIKDGHSVFIASPIERRYGKSTYLIKGDNYQILKIRTLNIQKTNVIEKGIGTLLLEYQFDKAIQRYWGDVTFDLVLYSTPPITFNRIIKKIKGRYLAPTYLMLKDIFPQNAVDLGMMSERSPIHKFFRAKERTLYRISDRIGCMSPANVKYVLEHNPEVGPHKVSLCPNALTPVGIPEISDAEKSGIKSSLNLPEDKTLFIYGGNLGKPQGIDFLLKVLEANEKEDAGHIMIIGDGTEFPKIKKWFDLRNPKNSSLMRRLPKEEYENLIRACDVGLIFLDPRFTIPNFPSRLLSYLENSMPVLMATDTNTDIGRIAESEGFGSWTESGNLPDFMQKMKAFRNPDLRKSMGTKGHDYMVENYDVAKIQKEILRSVGYISL